ncbi:MAG: DUF2470 domain-containing protein [Magnetospirillum sp.]|nr:DUF2470 domain-containing protein [Magnetospirillum sp.]
MSDDPASPVSDLPADNRLALRRVARACRKASLGTLTAECADPYVSLVTVALDHDLAPVLLLSGISDHTRNIAADPRVSLLFDGTAAFANPQQGPRVTLMGTARPCDDARLTARFLALHPGARLYAGFGDFRFWRVEPERVHFVGGFGRAVWFDAPFGLTSAAAVAAAEPDILAHMNAEHADAVAAMAKAAGGEGDAWRMVALDPDGCDLAGGETTLRLGFPTPIADAGDARTALVALAQAARP